MRAQICKNSPLRLVTMMAVLVMEFQVRGAKLVSTFFRICDNKGEFKTQFLKPKIPFSILGYIFFALF